MNAADEKVMPFWQLAFEVLPDEDPTSAVFQFAAINFGCERCLIVFALGEEYVKCSSVAVRLMSNLEAPPPDGEFRALGTFVSGGMDGQNRPSGDANSEVSASNINPAVTSGTNSHAVSAAGGRSCGSSSIPLGFQSLWGFIVGLCALLLRRRSYSGD